jgi:hypothetical protein
MPIVPIVAPGPAASAQPTTRPAVRRPPMPPPPQDEEEAPAPPRLRKLTEQEIWRIRFLELRGNRQGAKVPPESISVKVEKKQADEFLTLLEGSPKPWMPEDSSATDAQARAEFHKLTAAQKAHYIAAERGPAFADKIHIMTDPEVFKEFRSKVMPIVLRGCATTGCHGPTGSEEAKFHLYRDPKKAADTTYANFVILNDLSVGGGPIINRGQPSSSLLLMYMLPTKDVRPELRHPGKVEFKPVFQNRASLDYKRLENWIGSLKHPADDYGVHLLAAAAPPEAPQGPGGEGAPSP